MEQRVNYHDSHATDVIESMPYTVPSDNCSGWLERNTLLMTLISPAEISNAGNVCDWGTE